jgi:hypothetical protein
MKLGADMKDRSSTQRRLDPDAPAVHLHDLLGDGETETGAALCLGIGTVDLVELSKMCRLMFRGECLVAYRSR